MIAITEGTPSGDNFPVSFGGTITLQKVDESYSDYKFQVVGLRENSFTFWIPKADAGGSSIDWEACCYWLMHQVGPAASGTNSQSHSMNIGFSYDSISGGIATLNVSGSYNCVFKNLENDVFDLTIEGIGWNQYDVLIDFEDAGGYQPDPENEPDTYWPKPGDVFRWLMKKLKEAVCPTCL